MWGSLARSAQAWASRTAIAVLIAFMASARSSMSSATPACPAIRSRTITPSITRRIRVTSLTVFPGQPGLLVLDELEQRGLHLCHAGDLVQHQLPVLSG